jgi:hypothetical protein
MDLITINIIAFFWAFIIWEIFFSSYKVTLSSPIFRNTETKELGCWAERKKRLRFVPMINMSLWDRNAYYHIREISWEGNEFTLHTYFHQPKCTDTEQYEHIKKCLNEYGWKLREVPPGHILNWWKEEYET